MPFQINKLSVKALIVDYDHDAIILKKHYANLLQKGIITEAYFYAKMARRTAIKKVLAEVQKQKTTTINVEQIKLF